MLDLIEWGKKIVNFFNNIKTIFMSFIDFFPDEIKGLLLPVLLIVCALFLYRFLK